ncbi:MAG: shikimate kinase [Sphingomonadales bacterium]|nr:shikimate kinase [Sphingomonadales bacterium]
MSLFDSLILQLKAPRYLHALTNRNRPSNVHTSHMPMNENRIGLVGMPGSGKSTVGHALAALTGWPFHDLDDWLINRWSLSIAEQFSAWGEDTFREREQDGLQHHLNRVGPYVLATGGGTPIWRNQMNDLLKSTRVVWLDVDLGELCRRLDQNPEIRPLIASQTSTASSKSTKESLKRMQALHDARYPIYSKAHIHIAATGSPEEIAHQIIKRLKL